MAKYIFVSIFERRKGKLVRVVGLVCNISNEIKTDCVIWLKLCIFRRKKHSAQIHKVFIEL